MLMFFFNFYNMICNIVDLKDVDGLIIVWLFFGMFENVIVSMLYRVICFIWKFLRVGRRVIFLLSSIKWYKNCKCLFVNYICMIFLIFVLFILYRVSK